MCKLCYDAAVQYFPDVTPKQREDIIWACTAYPAGCSKIVAEQLGEIAERSGGDYDRAMSLADASLEWDFGDVRITMTDDDDVVSPVNAFTLGFQTGMMVKWQTNGCMPRYGRIVNLCQHWTLCDVQVAGGNIKRLSCKDLSCVSLAVRATR